MSVADAPRTIDRGEVIARTGGIGSVPRRSSSGPRRKTLTDKTVTGAAGLSGAAPGGVATVCDVKRYGIPFDFSLFDLIGLRGVCSRWRQEYRIGYRRYQNRLP